MIGNYYKEEVTYCERLPARILHQILSGTECYTAMHWHKDFEINLFLQGQAEFTVNGETVLLKPGDFVFINSEDLHSGHYPYNVPVADRYQELITIQLDYNFLRRYVDIDHELRFKIPKEKNQREDIYKYLVSIGKRFAEGGFCYEMDITADLLRLGSLLLRNYVVSEEELVGIRQLEQGVREMQKAVTYIDLNYASGLSLESMSQYMNLSPNYFSKRFRQMTGITFRDYLCGQRLKNAARDLLNTDLNITEIALKNGFPNVKAFIEGFRKMYLITPEKYRRKMYEEKRIENNKE